MKIKSIIIGIFLIGLADSASAAYMNPLRRAGKRFIQMHAPQRAAFVTTIAGSVVASAVLLSSSPQAKIRGSLDLSRTNEYTTCLLQQPLIITKPYSKLSTTDERIEWFHHNIGLRNNDGRCGLNSLFHVLTPALAPYERELEECSKIQHEANVVSAFAVDLKNYRNSHPFPYQLSPLYKWWCSQNDNAYDPNINKLISTFVHAWQQAPGKKPKIGYINLSSIMLRFQSVPLLGSIIRRCHSDHFSLPQELEECTASAIVLQQLPDILIVHAEVQRYKLRDAVYFDYVAQNGMDDIPMLLDLTKYIPQTSIPEKSLLYELVGIEIYSYEKNKEFGHSTSLAKLNPVYWVYVNNSFATKIPTESLRERIRFKHDISSSTYSVGDIFVYRRISPTQVSQT